MQKTLGAHWTDVAGSHMLNAAAGTAGRSAEVGPAAAVEGRVVVVGSAGEGMEEGTRHLPWHHHRIHDLAVGSYDRR